MRPQARVAVYASLDAAPQVIDLAADGCEQFAGLLASTVYRSSQEMGGSVPLTVIRELAENLIHAYFAGVTVSVFDGGNTIRVADHGPGVHRKDGVFEPGFTTATPAMRRFVRGVGSGLPIVRAALAALGGAVTIEDNLARGAVVTVSVPRQEKAPAEKPGGSPATPALTKRQKQVLSLVMELGQVGPSRIAGELGVGLSTAYRELRAVERHGLVSGDKQGKRSLTATGIETLDVILGR